MTTIAINYNEEGNIVIASDSRMASGNTINSSSCVKIFEIKYEDGDKCIVAGAGAYAHVLAFLDWCVEGMISEDFPRDLADSDFILVNKEGCFCFDDYPKGIPVDLPHTAGSGGRVALGAMMAGATPQEAVKIAAKVDPFTDSNVVTKVMEVEKKPKRRSTKHTVKKKKGA